METGLGISDNSLSHSVYIDPKTNEKIIKKVI